MNRRTYTAAMIAGLFALPAISVNAQRNRAASSLIVSETTGAEIDLSQSSFTVETHRVADFDDYLFEVIRLESHFGLIVLRFISGAGRYEFSEAYRIFRSYLEDEMEDEFEELGSEPVDGGGWMAFRLPPDLNSYHEVQKDAFPDTHLWIEAQLPHNQYAVAMEDVQAIDLAGMPLFLFLEDNDALGNLFPSASSRTDASRLAVPDRTATSRPTAEASVNDVDGGGVIEAVRSHQAQFHDELTRFEDVLQRMADGELVGADEMEFFNVMLEVTFSWQEYPATASALQFPPELSGLESTYIEWADAISQMGVTLGQVSTGLASAEDYIDAANIAIQLDQALSAELRTLGVVFKPAVEGFTRPNVYRFSVLKSKQW